MFERGSAAVMWNDLCEMSLCYTCWWRWSNAPHIKMPTIIWQPVISETKIDTTVSVVNLCVKRRAEMNWELHWEHCSCLHRHETGCIELIWQSDERVLSTAQTTNPPLRRQEATLLSTKAATNNYFYYWINLTIFFLHCLIYKMSKKIVINAPLNCWTQRYWIYYHIR